MTFPRSGLLMVCLAGWLISGISQRQRQTKFKATVVIPAQAGIQYAATPVVGCDVGVYCIIRWSLSSGAHSRDPLADDVRV
ncbi:MAG TPA: hypothetical protein VGA15_27635 [Bradyrhizobium sp.]